MACIFLAGKIEENCRRVRDVANVFHHMKQKRMGRYVEYFYLIRELRGERSIALVEGGEGRGGGMGGMMRLGEDLVYSSLSTYLCTYLPHSPQQPLGWAGQQDCCPAGWLVVPPLRCLCRSLTSGKLSYSPLSGQTS